MCALPFALLSKNLSAAWHRLCPTSRKSCMKTSPSSLKIRHIITQTKEGKLVPRPEFQRRLVWSPEDKIRFIDTILRGYPFPEIYVANGAIDVNTGEGSQLLVDGQQRVTTIVSYFHGDPSTFGASISPYALLETDEKEAFLNYDVAVRDLGSVTSAEIIEVFKRINSTKYPLNEVEVNNAVYAGELMRLASGFAEHEFFDVHKVFRAGDIKRMGDVRFLLQVIITMLAGYFNRDDLFEQFLSDFNDHFPKREEIAQRLLTTMSFIEECGFTQKSRIWKKSDLFTAFVELDFAIGNRSIPSPSEALERIESFYRSVEEDGGMESTDLATAIYAKASIQASNDRANRARRGVIFSAVLLNRNPLEALVDSGLI